jgi:hypothetical protein
MLVPKCVRSTRKSLVLVTELSTNSVKHQGTSLSNRCGHQQTATFIRSLPLKMASERKTAKKIISFVIGETASPPQWAMASSFTKFLDHTQRCTTVGITPLEGWSACRYLTTHNTHYRHQCSRWDSNPQSHRASDRTFISYSGSSKVPTTTFHQQQQ